MDKNPVAQKMARCMGDFAFQQLPKTDREKLEAHDPSNPFSHTSSFTKAHSLHGRQSFSMDGNCVLFSGQQKWFDEDGNEIDPGQREAGWTNKQGEALAEELKGLGLKANFNPVWHSSHPKEMNEICITLPHDYTQDRYEPPALRAPRLHGLLVRMKTQGISGEPETLTFNIRSWGRKDIAEKIRGYLLRRAEIMPKTVEESSEAAERIIRKVYAEAYAPLGKDLKTLKRKSNNSGLYYEGVIQLLDALLQENDIYVRHVFYGRDIDDIWKFSRDSKEARLDQETVKREFIRRQKLAETGLIQTAIARNIIAKGGYETLPLQTKDIANAKKYHISNIRNVDATLSVKNGRVEARVDIGDYNNQTQPWMRITTGKATLFNAEIPESLIPNLKGKPLNSLIENELLSDDITITSAKYNARRIDMVVRMPNYPVTLPTY